MRLTVKIICALTLVPSVMTTSVLAGDGCTCRGNGQNIPEGKTVCLNLPSGSILAKCDRVLNNAACKIIQKGCPIGEVNDPASPMSSDRI